MTKCRYCRTHGLWYQPRDDSPDADAHRPVDVAVAPDR
jgi:hypothetical protein